VATHYRDTGTGVDRGPGEAVRASGGPAETRGDTRHRPAAHRGAETRGASGTRRADSRGVQGWGRDVVRPEEGDDSQAPRVAHRALADVHARHAEHEGGHGLGHGDVVSQVELLKLHGVHVMPLDLGKAGQDREAHRVPTWPEPLCRPQRSLPSDLFPHEVGAAPPSKATPLRVLRAAPHRSPAQDDVDCNGSPITCRVAQRRSRAEVCLFRRQSALRLAAQSWRVPLSAAAQPATGHTLAACAAKALVRCQTAYQS